MAEVEAPARSRRRPRLRLLLPLILGALTVLAVLVVLTLVRNDEEELQVGTPTEVSLEDLREFAASLGHVVYWAGAVPGFKFELTHTRRGNTFVRYLPPTARIGDRRPLYTTVGTYPQSGAYATAGRAAKRRDMVRRTAPGGGIAVWSRRRPTSVYLAYPGADYLAEVYAVEPQEAQALALSGRVGPLR